MIEPFCRVMDSIFEHSTLAWVYLPATGEWTLDSDCAVLVSEEVPPELEDDPRAGYPEIARTLNLRQAIPVAALQDVVLNARQQKPNADQADLLAAFRHYYDSDAFIEF